MSRNSRILTAAAAVASALALSPAARAADLVPPASPAPPVTGFGWSGLYVGIGGGAGAVVHDLHTPAFGSVDFNGVGGEGLFGEATLGYDYMITNRFLLGGFVDGRFGNIETSLKVPGAGFSAKARNDYGFDVGAASAISSRRPRFSTYSAATAGSISRSARARRSSPTAGIRAASSPARAWRRRCAATGH